MRGNRSRLSRHTDPRNLKQLVHTSAVNVLGEKVGRILCAIDFADIKLLPPHSLLDSQVSNREVADFPEA